MADDFGDFASLVPQQTSADLGDFASLVPKKEEGWLDAAKDVVQSGGTGVVKGVTGLAGASGDVRELLASGASKVAGLAGYEVEPKTISNVMKHAPVFGTVLGGPTSEVTNKVVQDATGEFYKPKSTAGEYAQTLGEFLPNAAAGPGGLARRIGLGVVAPALASETAGQVTKGTAAEPYARAAAAIAAAPVVARGFTPLRTSEGRQAMVQNLADEGVTATTAGQRTGNKVLQYFESVLGDYPGAGQSATNQQRLANEQFTRAVLNRVGVHGPPTRANLDAQIQTLQNEFERLSANNVLRTDSQFSRDITNVMQRYSRKMPSQQRAVVDDWINDFTAYNGRIPGPDYQIARMDLSNAAHAARHSDPTYSQALRGLRNALDDAMNRSILPEDRAAWNQARERWGAWRTVEQAAKHTDANGNILITPANLKNAASTKDRGHFARGLGRFAALAQSGSGVMTTLPQSGTQPRSLVNALTMGTGAALGAGTGGLAVLPLLGGAAAPAAVGRALMSRPVQGYLSNTAIQGPSQSRQNALLKAYLATLGDEE